MRLPDMAREALEEWVDHVQFATWAEHGARAKGGRFRDHLEGTRFGYHKAAFGE